MHRVRRGARILHIHVGVAIRRWPRAATPTGRRAGHRTEGVVVLVDDNIFDTDFSMHREEAALVSETWGMHGHPGCHYILSTSRTAAFQRAHKLLELEIELLNHQILCRWSYRSRPETLLEGRI